MYFMCLYFILCVCVFTILIYDYYYYYYLIKYIEILFRFNIYNNMRINLHLLKNKEERKKETNL